jgi:hypothetical protein
MKLRHVPGSRIPLIKCDAHTETANSSKNVIRLSGRNYFWFGLSYTSSESI